MTLLLMSRPSDRLEEEEEEEPTDEASDQPSVTTIDFDAKSTESLPIAGDVVDVDLASNRFTPHSAFIKYKSRFLFLTLSWIQL